MKGMPAVGELLRGWRLRRRLSQLSLATDANISPKHLCFLETGRAQPSRDMLLRLSEFLEIPLRERNALLNAAGFAAEFPERRLEHSDLGAARTAIDVLLAAHRPYPAFAVDRYWTMVASNGCFVQFMDGVEPSLLQRPINVLRLTLHPQGLAQRLANYEEWRAHVLDKVRRQSEISGDPVLADLLHELSGFSAPRRAVNSVPSLSETSLPRDCHRFVVPFKLITHFGTLSFFTTTTVFGTPVDVTLSELSLESFYPADKLTAEVLRKHGPFTSEVIDASHAPTSDTSVQRLGSCGDEPAQCS
jgi:transcriptional regulator with XRE-family HTH domain